MRGAFYVPSRIALALGVLMGCASMFETEVTASNSHVQKPHFSFVAPPDQGWSLSKSSDAPESVVVVKRWGYRTCQMEITRIPIDDPATRAWPARQLADKIRDVWKQGMVRNGATIDATMSEETVGEQSYYTMEYVASQDSRLLRGWEYVYLPNETDNAYFVYSLYSESTPAALPFTRKSYCKDEFMETLKTLRVHP